MQQYSLPTVGKLSSNEFQNKTFPRVAAIFPSMLGHVDALPEIGDYYVSPHAGVYLLRCQDGVIRAYPNACPHDNAQLAPACKTINDVPFPRQGKCSSPGIIMCPWHERTFTDHGKSFRGDCADLHEISIEIVGGFIFEGGKGASAQLASLQRSPGFAKYGVSPVAKGVKFRLHKAVVCDEPYTAATGMKAFGDDLHVAKIHKGTFNAMVSMQSLRVETGEDWSVQFVEWGGLEGKVSPEYQRYMSMVRERCGDTPPEIGAIWAAYGANVTLEWYQCGPSASEDLILVVSTYIPKGRRTDISIEVYAPEGVVEFEPDLLEAFWAAYMKTADEDRMLCMSIDEGQRTLVAAGREDERVGVPEVLYEECLAHYYALLERCEALLGSNHEVIPIRRFG